MFNRRDVYQPQGVCTDQTNATPALPTGIQMMLRGIGLDPGMVVTAITQISVTLNELNNRLANIERQNARIIQLMEEDVTVG